MVRGGQEGLSCSGASINFFEVEVGRGVMGGSSLPGR